MDNFIIHTADWHIKIPSKHYERKWYIQRFKQFINSLPEGEIIVIAGDIFETIPSYLDTIFLLWALKTLEPKYTLMLICEGNHDYKGKEHYLLEILAAYQPYIPNLLFPFYSESINQGHLQFVKTGLQFVIVNHSYLKKKKIEEKGDILITHIRGDIKFAKEEYPIDELSKNFRLVLLGDLHKIVQYKDNVWYSSSPYNHYYTTIKSKKDIDNSVFGYNIISPALKISHIETKLPNKYKIQSNKTDVEVFEDNLIKYEKQIINTEIEQTEEIDIYNTQDIYKLTYNYLKTLGIEEIEPYIEVLRCLY